MKPVSTATGPVGVSTGHRLDVTADGWLPLEQPDLVVPTQGVRGGQAADAGPDDGDPHDRSVPRASASPRASSGPLHPRRRRRGRCFAKVRRGTAGPAGGRRPAGCRRCSRSGCRSGVGSKRMLVDGRDAGPLSRRGRPGADGRSRRCGTPSARPGRPGGRRAESGSRPRPAGVDPLAVATPGSHSCEFAKSAR